MLRLFYVIITFVKVVSILKNRLRELRKEKNMTLKQVSEKLGIASNTLSQYETNKREPKLKTWQALANFFNVPVSYLQGIGVSSDEMCDYLLDEFYSMDEIKNPINDEKHVFNDELERYISSDTNNKIESYLESKDYEYYYPEYVGLFPYVDSLIKNDFMKNIKLLTDYEYLSTINKDSLKSDSDTFRLRIIEKINNDRYISNRISNDFVLYGVDLFKLSSEIDNKFMRASTSNDKKELIKLFDEIIDMLKETKKSINNYDKKLNNTSDETTDKD